jgi:hypothetical protein
MWRAHFLHFRDAAMEHNPSPIILLCTYVGFYVALVQSETVRFSDLAQNLVKIKMSKIPVSFYCTPKNQIQKRLSLRSSSIWATFQANRTKTKSLFIFWNVFCANLSGGFYIMKLPEMSVWAARARAPIKKFNVTFVDCTCDEWIMCHRPQPIRSPVMSKSDIAFSGGTCPSVALRVLINSLDTPVHQKKILCTVGNRKKRFRTLYCTLKRNLAFACSHGASTHRCSYLLYSVSQHKWRGLCDTRQGKDTSSST